MLPRPRTIHHVALRRLALILSGLIGVPLLLLMLLAVDVAECLHASARDTWRTARESYGDLRDMWRRDFIARDE